jgi:prophage regulatory protein
MSVDDLQSAVEAAVRKALEDNAKTALPTDILDAGDLEMLYNVPRATWRWWHSVGQGPPGSFRLGRRRVWRRVDVERWIAEQEAATA